MSSTGFYALILTLLVWSLPAKAQTFEDGYQSYVRNQFPVAELQFKSALKKVSSDEERGIILKFIGICQFMRGDKKNAGNSFFQAVGFDRSLSIDTEEVLDPSVISFFNSIKSRVPPEPKRKPKPAVAETPPPPVKQAPPPQAAAPVKKKVKKKKKTDSAMAIHNDIGFEKRERKLSVMHFLPFGMPQFANDSMILGIGIAGLQGYAIYSMFDADKVIKDREGLNTLVRDKPDLTDDQRTTFYKENNAYVDELKKQKNLAIAGFGALWVISVAEGIINNRGTSSKTADMDDRPIETKSSVSPMIQAKRHGGGFGISYQTELK